MQFMRPWLQELEVSLRSLKVTTVNEIAVKNSISCAALSALGLLICLLFFVIGHWEQGDFGSLLKDPMADVNRFEGVVFVFFLSLSSGVLSAIGTIAIVLMGMKPRSCFIFLLFPCFEPFSVVCVY